MVISWSNICSVWSKETGEGCFFDTRILEIHRNTRIFRKGSSNFKNINSKIRRLSSFFICSSANFPKIFRLSNQVDLKIFWRYIWWCFQILNHSFNEYLKSYTLINIWWKMKTNYQKMFLILMFLNILQKENR